MDKGSRASSSSNRKRPKPNNSGGNNSNHFSDEEMPKRKHLSVKPVPRPPTPASPELLESQNTFDNEETDSPSSISSTGLALNPDKLKEKDEDESQLVESIEKLSLDTTSSSSFSADVPIKNPLETSMAQTQQNEKNEEEEGYVDNKISMLVDSQWVDEIIKMSSPALDKDESKLLHKSGLWWNYFEAYRQDLYFNLKPESMLINYVFQMKTISHCYSNDDLFDYQNLNKLFEFIQNPNSKVKTSVADNGLEIGIDDMLVEFSTTNEHDLKMRAMMYAINFNINPVENENPPLNEMKIYENLVGNCKLHLEGTLEDWTKLQTLIDRFRKRIEIVISQTSEMLSDQLLRPTKKVLDLIDHIISHKLNLVDGKYWDNLMWYYYDTHLFSGILCNLSLNLANVENCETIEYKNIVSEYGTLKLHSGPPPATPMLFDHILLTTPKEKTVYLADGRQIHCLDSVLRLFAGTKN